MEISNFQITVKAVITQSEHILLVREHQDKLWDMPGGRIRDDEPIHETLRRELREEIDCFDPQIGRLLYAERIPRSQLPEPPGQLMALFYEVRLLDTYVTPGVILPHPRGIWFSMEEVENLPLRHGNYLLGTIRLINQYNQSKDTKSQEGLHPMTNRNLFPIKYIHPLGAPIKTLYAEYMGNDIFRVYRDAEGNEPVVDRYEYDPITFVETFTNIDGRKITFSKLGNKLKDLRFRTGEVFIDLFREDDA